MRSFIDVLTNWYIRRSRQRFWDGDADAIDTLHTVLDVVVRVAAPLLPFVTEEVHDGLHARARRRQRAPARLAVADELPADDELVAAMDQVRDVCSATLSVRKAHGRRVRQPLATLTVAVPDAARLAPVRRHHRRRGQRPRRAALTDDVGAVAGQVLQVVPATIGPRLGRHTQDVIQAVKAGDWTLEGERVVAGGHWLEPGEFTLTMVADGDRPSTTVGGGTGVIVLDVDVTPELEQEGRARDLIRLVQQARRDADLAVTDRIELTITRRRRLDRRGAGPRGPDRRRDAGGRGAHRRRPGTDTPEIAVHRASADRRERRSPTWRSRGGRRR